MSKSLQPHGSAASGQMPERRADTVPGAPLFRPEALDHQRPPWLGTILLAPSIRGSLAVGFALSAAGLLILFAVFGSHTQKQRVSGQLVPDLGIARLVAPQAGIVTSIHVKEGETVRRDVPLVTLSSETSTAAYGTTQAEIVRQLSRRQDSVIKRKTIEGELLRSRERGLEERIAALRNEQKSLQLQIDIQADIIALTGETLAGLRRLEVDGFVRVNRIRQVQQDRLTQTARMADLSRNLTALQRAQMQLERELTELPLRGEAELSAVERDVALLSQQLAEAESKRQIVVTAPHDGTVTSIQTEPGGSVDTKVPLLSIVPEGAVLQAHLFSPSRAIGFVMPGQTVRLRYHAYAYQKFGTYEGVVANVSRAPMSPSEMPASVAGVSNTPGVVAEPLYRIVVNLNRQGVSAYGRTLPLRAGMKLDADLVISRRRLIEWVLDPLYAMSG